MTRKEVVKWLESLKREIGKEENHTLWHYAEAIDMAIKALDQVSHLNNRPCEACEYHKETGCVKWECVFEK